MPSNKKNNLNYIAGSEYFQNEQQKKILDNIEDCETESFSADDFSEEFFFNFINTPSMFQENKAAIIKASNKIKGIGDIISKCADCIETHLIFLSPEPKITKEISKALKDVKFEVSVEKKATKYDLTSKINQMFSDAGFRLDSSSAMEINEIFEGDLKQISNEVEKLSIYFAYKKPQSSAEIMNAVTARKQDNIFTFIDSFTAKRKKTCSILLGNFINSGENLNILNALLFKRVRELYLFINLRDQVKENRPWMLDKLKTGAKAWKHEDIVRLCGLYAELDYKNKTGQITIDNYLTSLVASL